MCGPQSSGVPREEKDWHGNCSKAWRPLTPQAEEDAMNRIRFVREIAVPAAIVFCYAGLSAFSHYATVMLARTT